jgi:hypothetical protein
MNRRDMLKITSASALGVLASGDAVTQIGSASVCQYDVFEVSLKGPSSGNPFVDVQLKATFSLEQRTVTVDGFYDGDGSYKIRFMPDALGEWRYTAASNASALNRQSGEFLCTAPKAGNHGPVSVRFGHHFGYADGTPYFPFGTTCYAWVHQGKPYEEQTLATLRQGPFNKIRMCVFPKSYEYNHNEPEFYLFPRTAQATPNNPMGRNDYSRFNPAFFAHFEQRLEELRELNIEADLILFHPYDRWGYAAMGADVDERYVRYIVARFGAYRNVWWSLANEFDLMKAKITQDVDRLLHLVQQCDPYQHLRSIHYSKVMYDYASPAVTHASLQSYDFASAPTWLKIWNKPIVYDEVMYEGDLPRRWGNLSGEEMTRRFWLGVVAGCYVTHGETYLNAGGGEDENDKIWWSNGGKLSGSSPARIGFLRKLLEETTAIGLEASPEPYYLNAVSFAQSPQGVEAKLPPAAILYYFDFHQPIQYTFPLGAGMYRAEFIDPWQMTITPIAGRFSGKATLQLPGKPYQAIRFRSA